MSQYIKKVGVTPVRGDGYIIDSFYTNDNKERNAPSLNAVEKRADNNLLFSSVFSNFTDTGYEINGWKVEPSSEYEGDMPAAFLSVTGLYIPEYYKGKLTSPHFMMNNPYKSLDFNKSYSLTVIFRTGANPDMLTEPVVGKLENITNDPEGIHGAIFDETLKIEVDFTAVNGRLVFNIENLTSSIIHIQAIKYEQGATATEYNLIGKDQGIVDSINSIVSRRTGGSTSILVQSFQTPSVTFVAGYENIIQGVIPIEGYTVKGILAVRTIVDGSDYPDIIGWWIGVDPNDNIRKVMVRLRNSNSVDISLQLYVTCLYVKNEDEGTSIAIESFSTSQAATLTPYQSATAKAYKIKDGYSPKGIISIEQTPTGSTYLDILGWWVGVDPEDDIRKVFVKLLNDSPYDVTFTMSFTVLYVRN